MHRSFRDLASHGNSAVYHNIQLNPYTLGTSYETFSIYLKPQFVNIYRVACTIVNCFVCENSTDVSYFSPLFANRKCMHFKLANTIPYHTNICLGFIPGCYNTLWKRD